ncbi:MAG: poly-gamma-glutamate biosynthesis protein PgsC/CapC [Candidatus Limnocylindrales bacterium]
MHEYLYAEDLVRVAVIAGVIVSTILYDRFQLTTGGAVVPGYLALFVLAPLSIVVTLASAYVTYRIVNGPIAARVILYGRRKFEIEVLIGLAIVSVLYGIAQLRLGLPPFVTAVYGIGFVVPGLIAHDMFRQGPAKTVGTLVGAIAVVALVIFVMLTLGEIAPIEGRSAPELLGSAARGYSETLLLPAIVVSVLAGLVIFRTIGLRTGGFVTAAYVALVSPDVRDLAFAAAVALATYAVVTRILSPRLLLFGRRKVAMMVLVAASLGWLAEVVIVALTNDAYHPWRGFNAITLMVPALLANDSERQGIERTVWGVTLATLAVLAATNLLTAVLDLVGATSASASLPVG